MSLNAKLRCWEGGFFSDRLGSCDCRVWACGNNDDGQLGVGDKFSRDVPTRVRGLPRCSAVAAGSRHSVALSLSGAGQYFRNRRI